MIKIFCSFFEVTVHLFLCPTKGLRKRHSLAGCSGVLDAGYPHSPTTAFALLRAEKFNALSLSLP